MPKLERGHITRMRLYAVGNWEKYATADMSVCPSVHLSHSVDDCEWLFFVNILRYTQYCLVFICFISALCYSIASKLLLNCGSLFSEQAFSNRHLSTRLGVKILLTIFATTNDKYAAKIICQLTTTRSSAIAGRPCDAKACQG